MTENPGVNPIGIIRTVVPVMVGAVVTWLAVEFQVVIDEGTSQALIAGFTGLATSIYYVLFRFLEKKVPALGWLLGAPSPPVYGVEPSRDDLIPLSEAERMAEEAATEAYRQIEVGGGE